MSRSSLGSTKAGIGHARRGRCRKSFTYRGDSNYDSLLKHVDVTIATRGYESQIPGWVNAARDTRQQKP
jgi:hypothetical protein